jgi:hypothetical protein
MASSIVPSCARCGETFHRTHSSQRYCSLECRFWSKVDKNGGANACWEWTAKARSNYKKWYGAFNVGGRVDRSHRVAWELENGAIPEGLCVCHRCDNPKCCNPAHLFLGSHAENMSDMRAKGRHVTMGPELVERLRQMKIGKPRSPEVRAKLSAALKGKPGPTKGMKMPKIAEAKRRWWAEKKGELRWESNPEPQG